MTNEVLIDSSSILQLKFMRILRWDYLYVAGNVLSEIRETLVQKILPAHCHYLPNGLAIPITGVGNQRPSKP